MGTLTDYPFSRAGDVAWNALPQSIQDDLRKEADPDLWMKRPAVMGLPEHLQAIVDYSARITSAQNKQLSVHCPGWLADDRGAATELGNLWMRCADVGTKLSALSREDTVALLIHGYVQAMGAAAVLVATGNGKPGSLPIDFPGFERFERLLEGPTGRPAKPM